MMMTMMWWHLLTGLRTGNQNPKFFLFYFESGSHIALACLELNLEIILLLSPECCHHGMHHHAQLELKL